MKNRDTTSAPGLILFVLFLVFGFLSLMVRPASASISGEPFFESGPTAESTAIDPLESAFKPHFCLLVSFGGARLSGSDLNDGLDSLIYEFHHPHLAEAEGDYRPIHWGVDAVVELVFYPDPRLGFGLSLGYVSTLGPTTSLRYLEWVPPPYRPINYTALYKPSISAFPLLLSFHYAFIKSRVFSAEVVAAGGIYFGTIGLDVKRTGSTYLPFNESWRGRDASFGSQEGLELKVRLGPRIDLTGELLFRQAGLPGARGTYTADGKSTEDAYMWIDTYLSMLAAISPSMPTYVSVRKADVSLSGFSLRLGLEIRL